MKLRLSVCVFFKSVSIIGLYLIKPQTLTNIPFCNHLNMCTTRNRPGIVVQSDQSPIRLINSLTHPSRNVKNLPTELVDISV